MFIIRHTKYSVMKKYLLILIFIIGAVFSSPAQAYRSLNIIPTENVTIDSKEGIVVQSVYVNTDRSISVTFSNTNSDRENERDTYTFEWYLSYKGKRVSDYHTEAIRCKRTANRTVYIWPDEVPQGHEKYVTVQLGREPRKKDPRDDD